MAKNVSTWDVLFLLIKSYTFGGQRVAIRQGSEVYYLGGDHLGSTSLTTDSSGGIISEVRYLPYGQVRWSNGTSVTDFGFTSQRNEASFGLLDYNARYYSAVLGRFVSPDTIVPDPLSSGGFNRYRYTRNNPLRYIDPSGHCIVQHSGDVRMNAGPYGTSGLCPNSETHVSDGLQARDDTVAAIANNEVLNAIPPSMPFFNNVFETMSIALRGNKNRAYLDTNVTNALANDPAMVNYQNSLIFDHIMADPRYGNENFDIVFDNLEDDGNLIGFGGIGKIQSIPNELTWLIRNVYVDSSASVNKDGTIIFTHQFIDRLDLRPSADRNLPYNVITAVLGGVYHGALGAPAIDISAKWEVEIKP